MSQWDAGRQAHGAARHSRAPGIVKDKTARGVPSSPLDSASPGDAVDISRCRGIPLPLSANRKVRLGRYRAARATALAKRPASPSPRYQRQTCLPGRTLGRMLRPDDDPPPVSCCAQTLLRWGSSADCVTSRAALTRIALLVVLPTDVVNAA